MLAVVVGMIGVLSIVSRGIDDHQRERDQSMVGLRLARIVETAGEDLEPVTVWDEAVRELSKPTAAQWFDRFVGGVYTGRHGHLATFSYDASGEMLRANHADGLSHSGETHPMERAARPLIDQLAAQARARDRSTHGRAAALVNASFIRVDGAVYIVAVSTVVRHTSAGPATGGDPMIASFKPFDAEVEWIRTRMGKTDVRFSTGAEPPNGMAGIPILDANGARLGQIVWTPDHPGYRILTHALPLLLLMMAVLAASGGLLMWRMFSDMRRLRASEAALSAALEHAEAANAAKSRFLSNVSHELRTPLNGVLGMAEVLGQDALTHRQRERLDILKEAGNRQLRLIEDLLDVVRLGDGAVTLDERPFRPSVLLRSLYNDHRAAAAAKGVSLKVEAPEGEWLGDAVHLEKLLGALVHNAIRFTESGAVNVRVLVRDGMTFEVQDTGAGMTKAEAAVLFDPFAQGDDSRTRKAEGLGLGLTAANGLARLMGGRIEVESSPGCGSLFRVTLPLAPALRSSEAAAA
ncbi:ATP-binding protein [Brevundimonas sp. SL130]|uniref:ATP-binding protein n=1 Tax=Brevundimonas sp. SL130 TaxID=2995143 RepID=UPI00226C99DB|nr:ATP-binding protein [Brevundimonas sp. SL130]WAC60966.1 ATP-binding protein [Brevundimonas sp. SL130]